MIRVLDLAGSNSYATGRCGRQERHEPRGRYRRRGALDRELEGRKPDGGRVQRHCRIAGGTENVINDNRLMDRGAELPGANDRGA